MLHAFTSHCMWTQPSTFRGRSPGLPRVDLLDKGILTRPYSEIPSNILTKSPYGVQSSLHRRLETLLLELLTTPSEPSRLPDMPLRLCWPTRRSHVVQAAPFEYMNSPQAVGVPDEALTTHNSTDWTRATYLRHFAANNTAEERK